MADEAKQVTVRFESQINDPQEGDPILLSGPIEIFATTDTFSDLGNNETREAVLEYVNKYNEANETEGIIPSIIIFVDNVTSLSMDNPSHRGAYFRYCGKYEDLLEEKKYNENLWKEILLGTHSHHNAELMNKLDSLDDQAIERLEKLLSGTEHICSDGPKLPELPQAIKDRYENLEEPTDASKHHLDANLSDLQYTYDWTLPVNIAYGSCRDVYREVMHSDKKLYLLKEDNLYKTYIEKTKRVNPISEVTMEIDRTNDPYLWLNIYDLKEGLEDYPTNKNYYLVRFPVDENFIESVDQPFVFLNGKLLSSDSECEMVSSKNDELDFRIRKSIFEESENEELNAVLVIVKDCDLMPGGFSRLTFVDSIEARTITLDQINNDLLALYMEGGIARSKDVPHLYLATDAYGNIHWENKLFPSQTFYHESIKLSDDYINDNLTEDGRVKIVFNTKFNAEEDFPVLMADEYFMYSVLPDLEEEQLTYYLDPEDPKGISGAEKLTLILIRNSLGSIEEELRENYISKADAVSILSHGKLNLENFVKYEDLLSFSKIGHKHTEYALSEHDHDYRYANYHHTHPELLKAVAELIAEYTKTEDAEVILSKLEKIEADEKRTYSNYIESLLKNAGFELQYSQIYKPVEIDSFEEGVEYFKKENDEYVLADEFDPNETYYIAETEIKACSIKDSSVKLDNETVEHLNDTIKSNFTGTEVDFNDLLLSEGATIKDAMLSVIKMFQKDTTLDSQVLLEDDIMVNLVNGPIGGLDEAWVKKNVGFKKGDTVQKVLREILNPYISVSDMLDILKPVSAELTWWVEDTSGSYNEVNPLHLNFSNEARPIYFRVKSLKNKFNEPCSYKLGKDLDGDGENDILYPKYIVKDYEEVSNNLYRYSDAFDFSENINSEETRPEIIITWENSTIYDNYGSAEGTLNENNEYITVVPKLVIDYVDTLVGSLSGEKLESVSIDTSGLETSRINKTFEREISITDENNIIVIFVENSLLKGGSSDLDLSNVMSIIEDTSKYNIASAFKMSENRYNLGEYGTEYTLYSYEVYDTSAGKIKLTFNLL